MAFPARQPPAATNDHHIDPDAQLAKVLIVPILVIALFILIPSPCLTSDLADWLWISCAGNITIKSVRSSCDQSELEQN